MPLFLSSVNNLLKGSSVFRRPPLFMALIPFFFYLHNLNEFYDLLFSKEIFLFLAIWLILPFLIYFLVAAVTQSKYESVVCISVYITVFFFFFGSLQDFFHNYKPLIFISKTLVLVILFFFFGIIAVYFFNKRKYKLAGLIKYSRIVFIVLVLFESLLMAKKIATAGTFSQIAKKFTSPLPVNSVLSKAGEPDIYYIIFDGYASSDALKDHWHYDNPIDSFLSGKGFLVLKNSKSNYNFTPFSIASTFNMQYLKNADKYLQRTDKNFYIGKLALQNNMLFETLRSNNYSVNIYSFLYNDEQLNQFGIFAPGNPLHWLRKQTLERVYIKPWLLNTFANFFREEKKAPGIVTASLQHYLDYNDNALENILTCKAIQLKKNNHPIFNYTHFLLPHAPYVYDENGNINRDLNTNNDMKSYLKQVKYSNSIIKKIVMNLLNDSVREKIIIIQGDHGFRSFSDTIPVQEEYRNFNAIYFYTKDYSDVSSNPGMINTYRIVMNKFFKTNFPFLKDSIVFGNRALTRVR
jgi:hypothetical protein